MFFSPWWQGRVLRKNRRPRYREWWWWSDVSQKGFLPLGEKFKLIKNYTDAVSFHSFHKQYSLPPGLLLVPFELSIFATNGLDSYSTWLNIVQSTLQETILGNRNTPWDFLWKSFTNERIDCNTHRSTWLLTFLCYLTFLILSSPYFLMIKMNTHNCFNHNLGVLFLT